VSHFNPVTHIFIKKKTFHAAKVTFNMSSFLNLQS
jgi:hypothetical protein